MSAPPRLPKLYMYILYARMINLRIVNYTLNQSNWPRTRLVSRRRRKCTYEFLRGSPHTYAACTYAHTVYTTPREPLTHVGAFDLRSRNRTGRVAPRPPHFRFRSDLYTWVSASLAKQCERLFFATRKLDASGRIGASYSNVAERSRVV